MLEQVSSILEKIKYHDIATYEHSIKVSKVGMYLAVECGFNKTEIEMTEVAGLLHDCGKLKISKAILIKPGPLTGKEFDEIRIHPKYSRDIVLENMLDSELLGRIVMEHHERNDGSGYPESKSNMQISKIAKIISIADSYDVMRSVRCYKLKMSDQDIINEFISCKGKYEESYMNAMVNMIQNNTLQELY